jgi:hypothetical protein
MAKSISTAALTIFGLCMVLLYSNCTSTTDPSASSVQKQSADVDFYFHQMTGLTVEVAYEPGAEPYTGTTAGGINYWDFLKDNLQAVFQGRPITFQIPHSLSEMKALPTQNQSVWTPEQVVSLASQYRSSQTQSAQGHFFVVFLKGYAASENGSANPNIIGFSVTGTTVIAIFKEVVQSTGTLANGPVPKYVEQSTLIHEMGHAIGFVNNGLPMTVAHQDSAHGAHCSNPNCVMYYLNEGKSDMAAFVQKFIQTGSTVMFDQQCLQDSQSF